MVKNEQQKLHESDLTWRQDAKIIYKQCFGQQKAGV